MAVASSVRRLGVLDGVHYHLEPGMGGVSSSLTSSVAAVIVLLQSPEHDGPRLALLPNVAAVTFTGGLAPARRGPG